jgi:hypothetical protein
MTHKVWRLSENSGDDNLGLACTEQGLMLGRTLLIERRDGRFVVREQSELECLFSLAYGREALLAGGVPPVAAGEAAAAEHASEAWTYGWARRGQYFDQLLRDGSPPALFRTIDNFTDGIATSIKSIDLNAATYQDAARLTGSINTLTTWETTKVVICL